MMKRMEMTARNKWTDLKKRKTNQEDKINSRISHIHAINSRIGYIDAT